MVRNHWASYMNKIVLLILCVILLKLLLPVLDSQTTTESPTITNPSEKDFLEKSFDPSQNLDIDESAEIQGEITDEMKEVIDKLRRQIERETTDYNLPPHKHMEELIPEKGGTPLRSVVLTTWRSGSTFIGGVLNSHPATYHFSEPLTDYRTVQVRGEPLASPAVRALRSMLTCNYAVLGRYLERSQEYTWLFTHNTRLWKHCASHRHFCWEPEFLTPVCRLFPFQSMKVVHLRLRLVEELLADRDLNVRVVLLVRDPRGVMESRASLNWCRRHEDCGSPLHLCADMVDDYSAALRFSALFPNTFKVVRYEDMSLDPDVVMPDVFRFFGLQYHPDVQEFVRNHTRQSNSHKYSTYRNSSATALLWRSKSNFSRVRKLQETCRVALQAWGYLPARTSAQQRTFNPLVQPFHFP